MRTALETIAANLKAASYPAMLLSPNRYRNRVIPPTEISVSDLTTGQVTTGNIAVQISLALQAYEHIISLKDHSSSSVMYVQDYLLFEQIRKQEPQPSIEVARDRVIGIHDGLRRQVYLRSLFGIPPTGLLNRERISKLMFWKTGLR